MPRIEKIRIGNYLIKTWFVAPYPEEYSQYPILFFCEFCLKYMHSEFVAGRHKVSYHMIMEGLKVLIISHRGNALIDIHLVMRYIVMEQYQYLKWMEGKIR